MKFHLTPKSLNRKTGLIPVTTSSKETCPENCPLRNNGCYADGGPLALHWQKVTNEERGDDWPTFLTKIQSLPKDQLWRHNQAGDLVPYPPEKGSIHPLYIEGLILANEGKRGYTYTHYPVLSDIHGDLTIEVNRLIIKDANKRGFIINLSGNTIEHADDLFALNIAPVTTHVASTCTKKTFRSPAGNKVIVCPAVINDKMSCLKCGLCAKYPRKEIIAFPAHGVRKSSLDRFIRMMEE